MTNKPLVTILIPTYNRASLLADAIESAIKQSYTNIEILISDNCSEDNTQNLCEQYTIKDSRIKYFTQEKNTGLINNCNFLVSRANGDFIVWLCDDDWLDLDYVEKSVKFLIKHSDYTFVSPRTILYKGNKKKIRTCDYINLEQDTIEERLNSFISKFPFADIATGVFRKKYVDKMLESDKTYYKNRYGEDSVFIIKYLFAGKGKVLNNTHHNKRENGYTRNPENIPEDVYSNCDISLSGWDTKMGEILIKSIIEDNFYKIYYPDTENIIPVIKKAVNQLIKYRSYKELVEYIFRHPFFIKRKAFYKYLNIYIRNINHENS